MQCHDLLTMDLWWNTEISSLASSYRASEKLKMTSKEEIIHATKERRTQDLVLNKDKDTCDRNLSLQLMWLLHRRISLKSTGLTLSRGSGQATSYYPSDQKIIRQGEAWVRNYSLHQVHVFPYHYVKYECLFQYKRRFFTEANHSHGWQRFPQASVSGKTEPMSTAITENYWRDRMLTGHPGGSASQRKCWAQIPQMCQLKYIKKSLPVSNSAPIILLVEQ